MASREFAICQKNAKISHFEVKQMNDHHLVLVVLGSRAFVYNILLKEITINLNFNQL